MCFTQVSDLIHTKQLFSNSDHIILSFSCGADSVFLFTYLKENHPKEKLKLVYFDHGLRPDEVKKERAFIKKIEKTGFKIEIIKLPIKEIQQKEGGSIETIGRVLRKKALIKLAKQSDNALILTAHHLDDCYETFLHRLSQILLGLFKITELHFFVLNILLEKMRSDLPRY